MRHVFINCPFDHEYQPLFRALVFAVLDCGFFPRCALERDDGSEPRIEKIRRIIDESDFGLHDISRTELDAANGLPRFNMPLELGMYLGARYFGRLHGGKACVIFDRERYRYQKFCSDLAGHDIRAHGGEEHALIRGVRDAARTWVPDRVLPGAGVMFARYSQFVTALPSLTAPLDLDSDALTFADLVAVTDEWLRLNRPFAPAS
ncbi:hypothetical protein [Longimicrobium sp.]|uniref:hypothetical protein n=1 Tax=Longimicrobium sp. TaxID=2029185 RepID=UPI002D80912D|nr:hypothetical protein [Longimicrobium sp.]